MKLLAFDTSTEACSIAVQNMDRVQVLHEVAPMQHARLILPFIQQLLDTISLTLDELDAIVYGGGPGSFTGIRMASTVAQGLGFASGKPVIRISSLAAIAQSAFMEHQHTHFMVAVDARMAEVYWALYEVAHQTNVVRLIGKEQVCFPENVCLPKNHGWHGVGNGWEKYREKLALRSGCKPTVVYPEQFPTARALLQLAREPFNRGEWMTAAEAVPVYLR